MILHVGELWLVLAVAFGGGGLVGSVFFRAIEQSGAGRLQDWLIRQVDRLVGKIERRLMPWREPVAYEAPGPILMPPPAPGQPLAFGQAPILTLRMREAEPQRLQTPQPAVVAQEKPIEQRRRSKKFRDAVARGDAAGMRPLALKAPRRESADDLTQIRRVAKRNAARLYGAGIYHFSQIAAWTPKEAAWVAAFLDVGDSIAAEDWVGQATRLASSEDFPMVRPSTEAPATLDAAAGLSAEDG